MGVLIFGLILLSLVLSLVAVARDTPLTHEFGVPEPPDATLPREHALVLDYTAETGQAHSPSILTRADGFSVIWFEGSAEAQADVDLYAVRITRRGATWQAGPPAAAVTRSALGAAMEPCQLVVTLGNTIEDQGKGGLLATVVSVGGWAMASVARVTMGPTGPEQAGKLSLSPMLNRSVLVKSPMVGMADGRHALPAYFEMGRMHGLWVRFAPDGRVRDTARMDGSGLKPIQPMVIPLGNRQAVAFLRDFDTARQRLLTCHSHDGGQSWSAVRETAMFNPSSPVAALALGGGRILMAANDDADAPGDLRLLISDDAGATWTPCHRFEGGDGALRYPMLRRLDDGRVALSYSHSTKGGVRAHVFTARWLEPGA